MIKAYYRPATLDEAVALLLDKEKDLRPLGGGTRVSRQQEGVSGVVDLQNLCLDYLIKGDGFNKAGSTLRLGPLLKNPDVHPEIKRAILVDTHQNIRNAATTAGWLVSSDGRSIFTTVLLALDAKLTWEPGGTEIQLGDWLPIRYVESPGILITEIGWRDDLQLAFEYVARSPKDRPLVIVAVARWNSGRTRVALGGFGNSPIMAMDGPESGGADVASRAAYYDAEDQWATAQYRREVVAKLALRCVDRLNQEQESEA